jgi:hypothetical protein
MRFHRLAFASLAFLLFFTACTEARIKKYEDLLEPMLGKAEKPQIDKLLGSPASCAPIETYQRCEYRTSQGRNDPVPFVGRKNAAMGPDLSPFEYFDVLALTYDGFGTLREWEPIAIQPN